MRTSEQVNEIVAALCKARLEFGVIQKSKKNLHFDSSYAALDDYLDAVVKPLATYGIMLTGGSEPQENGYMLVTCRIIHVSGQWMENGMLVRDDANIQRLGSGVTYAYRYSLWPLLGVTGETDDDGNAASESSTQELSTRPARASHRPRSLAPTTSASQSRPSATDIDWLWSHANSAVGKATDVRDTTFRRAMGTDGSVRMSLGYLKQYMTMPQYEAARADFDALIKREVEEDVTDSLPPNPPASEPEGVLETVEIQGETVEVELQPPAEARAAESQPVASTDDRVTLDSPQVKALLAEAEGFVKIQHDLRETVNRVGGISAKAFKDSEGNFRNRIASAKRAHEEAKQRAQGTLV